jgi:hypothetical protein
MKTIRHIALLAFDGVQVLDVTVLFAAGLLAAQPSFANPVPVPADKAACVGEWLGKNLSLSIELQGFNGDNFDAGYSLVRSTFVVSKPPHREDGKMKMTVDGVELTRTE